MTKDSKNAQAAFYLGVVLDKEGKFNDAMDAMKKSIEMDPSNPEPFNYVGYSYAEKGIHLGEAEHMVLEAIRLEPDSPFYKDSLAWVWFQKGDLSKAVTMQETAVGALKKPRKEDAVMYEHLGDMYLKLNRKDDAAVQWARAVEIDPSLASARSKLGLPVYVPPTPTATPQATPKKKKTPGKHQQLKKSVANPPVAKKTTAIPQVK
jgi:Flp pilus assembly protein TadD